ncbi:hypothetical protein SAMN05421770_10986 [Granulicella rosea]|uniref:PIN domain-containing protein n=1 Tax=Granulicella rosea TaxID=474952 RepID=A0A239M5C2_9BACT|nr:PIN domain nuclease [Granulicella rosea]SNT37194.1 hypothetical protein SAMN05421770_10986 [Granulicella rosea]
MVIVDTSVWVDYLRGVVTPETMWLEIEVDREPIGLTDLILCEILQGISTEANARLTQHELERFTVFNTGGESLAVAAAENYRALRARGYTIRKTIDCVIATFCLMEGYALLHRDRDFNAFETELGLRVVHSRLFVS